MHYAIIDVETTGHPLNKITDVAVFSTDGERLIREFHSLVNPGVNIPYNITRLTGISNDTVQMHHIFMKLPNNFWMPQETVFLLLITLILILMLLKMNTNLLVIRSKEKNCVLSNYLGKSYPDINPILWGNYVQI